MFIPHCVSPGLSPTSERATSIPRRARFLTLPGRVMTFDAGGSRVTRKRYFSILLVSGESAPVLSIRAARAYAGVISSISIWFSWINTRGVIIIVNSNEKVRCELELLGHRFTSCSVAIRFFDRAVLRKTKLPVDNLLIICNLGRLIIV